MGKSIHLRRMSHPNVVVENYDASLAHLRDLFGAEFLLDMPRDEWHACLVEIGGVIFEYFAPHNFLLNSRHGPHFLGIEYEADMTEVREVCAAHGVGIIRELGVACHTNPIDCLGVDFEFYEGSFFDNPINLIQTVKPVEYWRDQHPLGLMGLKAYTLVVSDMAAASRFLQSFLETKVVYEADRPAIGARALGLQTADCVLELLTPQGRWTGPAGTPADRAGHPLHGVPHPRPRAGQALFHRTERQADFRNRARALRDRAASQPWRGFRIFRVSPGV
jgi:catechol 2,3-dioxygenase-like lactoylglutathione lyase family enzyme